MPVATIEKLAREDPGLKLDKCLRRHRNHVAPRPSCRRELTASHLDSVGLPCPGAHMVVMGTKPGMNSPPGNIGETLDPEQLGHQRLLEQHQGDSGKLHQRILALRRSRLDRSESGFVRVFDRQKDMINRGGHKIYSAEVESVLAGHPDGGGSAIIAKPCPVLGERVHAVIVTRTSGALDADALRLLCAKRQLDYKVPETIDLTLRTIATQRQRQGDEEDPAGTVGGVAAPTAYSGGVDTNSGNDSIRPDSLASAEWSSDRTSSASMLWVKRQATATLMSACVARPPTSHVCPNPISASSRQ